MMRMAHHHTEMLSDAEFLEQFDAGTLDLDAFDHEAHVRAAWLCLRAAPFREAVARLRRGLKRLAISAGQPQRYHETITVAYARLIHRQMRLLNDPPWEEFTAQSPDLLGPDLAAAASVCTARRRWTRQSRARPSCHRRPGTSSRSSGSCVSSRRGRRICDARPAEPATPADAWTGAERSRCRTRVRDRGARRRRRRTCVAVVRRRVRLRRRAVPATPTLPIRAAVAWRRRADAARRSRCRRRAPEPGMGAVRAVCRVGASASSTPACRKRCEIVAPAAAHALPRRRVRSPRPRRLHRRRQRMDRSGQRHSGVPATTGASVTPNA